ncbi:MAG: hypothetical protein C3F11_08155 [Methylocystaceae bacterium]|nr:MAG: hypothetical protein C3F11_08155 [Methylocystaceae bacterium]
MESIKLWFQDWSDACEYAKECVPDLSFVAPGEPFSALASIAAACFALWWWNERAGEQPRQLESSVPSADEGRHGELERLLDRARAVRFALKKAA